MEQKQLRGRDLRWFDIRNGRANSCKYENDDENVFL